MPGFSEKAGDLAGGVNPLLVNLSFLISEATGLTTYAANLFPHLQALHPILLSDRPISPHRHHPIPGGMNASRGSRGHFDRLVWTQFQLPRIYKALNSSLLFSPIPEAPLAAGCRSIVTVHDLIPLRFPKRTSPLTYYCRYYIPQILQHAQHVICNSSATAKDVIDYFGIPASKITPIPMAYDAQHFQPLPTTENHPPYFFYIGRHDPYKNLHRLIAAFAQIKGDGLELWIAGSSDPRYTPSLQTQTEELGIAPRVKFLDYVTYDRLPGLMGGAIALVFPSLWEGFGFPILEAMACGTAVITSNLASMPEVAGDAAILVDPYNVQELSTAMQQLMDDPQMRSQLETAGLARATQFSWQKTGHQTAELLRQYL
ncbi:MAG: glycosyltransferase family 4 protein [Leptolyngbyaceae cyanobacterium SL_7_1]|nr:glycosyltransferase family 4 protein [Leptolyngbyaceae cyanobacterium SL_7_1]